MKPSKSGAQRLLRGLLEGEKWEQIPVVVGGGVWWKNLDEHKRVVRRQNDTWV